VPAILRGRLLGIVRADTKRAAIAQRQDELREQIVEADRVPVEVLGRSAVLKRTRGRLSQPSIATAQSSTILPSGYTSSFVSSSGALSIG
jgi:hypothetical protein